MNFRAKARFLFVITPALKGGATKAKTKLVKCALRLKLKSCPAIL